MSVGSIANKKSTAKSYSYTPVTQVVAGSGDPYFYNTSLLLLGNGANAGANNVYLDSSTNNATVTVGGTPVQGTVSPFATGGGSALLNGSTDYLQVPNIAGFAMGSNNFTIEAWVYQIANTTGYAGGYQAVVSQDNILTPSGSAWTLYFVAAGKPAAAAIIGGTAAVALSSASAIALNVWTHMAFVRNGSTFTLYVNGTSVASTTNASALDTSTQAVRVGLDTGAGAYFNGYVSQARVVNGTAVYTTNFTPPTAPLTAITNTSLLLNFNNAQIVDSTKQINVQTISTAQASTTQLKYGVAAMKFNGTSDYLQLQAGNAALLFGSGDFTIEAWVYPNVQAARQTIVCGQSDGSTAAGSSWYCAISNTSITSDLYIGGAAASCPSPNPLAGQWSHVAWVRFGTTWKSYLNGIQVGSVTASGSVNNGSTTLPPTIGDAPAVASSFFNGYIDDLRITKGVARYVQNFQVPQSELPTFYSPLTYDPYFSLTSLLLHGDGNNSANNTTVLDSSVNNLTVTATGSPAQGSATPFTVPQNSAYTKASNGGSIYFNGSTDYLSTPDNAVFTLGSGSFTVELWVYATANSATYGVFGKCTAAASNAGPFLITIESGTAKFYASTTAATWDVVLAGAFGTVPLNTWTHLAVVRNGTAFTGYLNGVGTALTTSSSTLLSNAAPVLVGAANGASINSFLPGYVSNARIVKGTAVYTSNFTPPTAPLTAITNTSLLLSGTNAAIFDNTAKNNLSTAGNSATMVVVSKFGGSSLYFDGTGDYLTIPSQTIYDFGTGDWTVEAQLYVTAAPGVAAAVFAKRSSSAAVGPLFFGIDPTLHLTCLVSADGTTFGVNSASTGVLTLNTWYHAAWVRSGSTITLYINGTASGTATAVTPQVTTQTLSVGGLPDGTYTFTGYIDDLRVTKGMARYTSGFVPPSTAFPDK